MNDQMNETGVWFATDTMSSADAVSFAKRVEELGYSALWLPETFGRDPFAHIALLANETERMVLATGIANVYNRHPGVMHQVANTLAEQMGNRFLLGLGVSSPQIVERGRGLDYSKPLTHLQGYLDDMESARYLSYPPAAEAPLVLAALGPKMVALAGERSAGAHTYNVSPEHTAWAREILGPDAELLVEQKVVLCDDAAQAREVGRKTLGFYLKAPGYRRAWNRLGFSEADIDAGSDGFIDAIVAHGDVEALRERIDQHRAAGATHVCVQPLDPDAGFGSVHWPTFEALAPAAVTT